MKHKRLIVIAGATCSGKTFFLHRLRDSSSGGLLKKLRIDDISLWMDDPMRLRHEKTTQDSYNLFIHYDFQGNYPDEDFTFSVFTDLVNGADEVTVVTLYAPKKILYKRNLIRIFRQLYMPFFQMRWLEYGRFLRRRWRISERFKKSDKCLPLLYSEWFVLLNKLDIDNFTVDTTKPQYTLNDSSGGDNIIAMIS